MKNTVKMTAVLLMIAILIVGAVSCTQKVDPVGLWENATYLSDTTLGSGANTVKVEVTAGDQTVVFTVKTDKATLGEALYEVGLINDPSFFDVCNGMKADWNADQAYWGFFVNGKRANYGVGDAEIDTSGETTYRVIYTK